MSRDHDNLLRGQGLFRQAIAGFAVRWKAYGLTIAGAAVIGGIGLPLNKVESWQFVCAYAARARGLRVIPLAPTASAARRACPAPRRAIR